MGRDKCGAARLIGRQVERAISKGTNTDGEREHEARAGAMRVRQLVRRYSAHTVGTHSLDRYVFSRNVI